MAADSQHAVETVSKEPVSEAYISPAADFFLLSVFVSILAFASVAVMLP